MTLKRICAYLIDSIIIFAIITLFSKIEILNPNTKEYNEAINQYYEVYEDYMISIKNGGSELINLQNQINDISYSVSKNSIPTSILNIVITILYFVIFQYFNNGQTIGKRLLGIKIINKSKEKPTFTQILIRSIIIYGFVTTISSLVILSCCSKEVYFNTYTYLSSIESILILLSFVVMLFREDKRGLHDLIAGTSVIETKSLIKEIKEK